MYSFQWKRRLMYRRSFNAPLASRLSVSIEARKTGRASSSRKPGTSTLISTQLFWPWPLPSLCSSPLLMVASSSSSWKPSTGRCSVLPTSALTPTRASVPSSRAMRALPLALGSTSNSARMERKSRGPFVTSRRSGGVWLRVERRNESSAGERLTRAAWGGMAGEKRCAVLWGQQWQCGAGAGGDACWSWNFCQAARGLQWVLANQRRCVMAFNSGAGSGSEATDGRKCQCAVTASLVLALFSSPLSCKCGRCFLFLFLFLHYIPPPHPPQSPPVTHTPGPFQSRVMAL
jgi:hypothetical protein